MKMEAKTKEAEANMTAAQKLLNAARAGRGRSRAGWSQMNGDVVKGVLAAQKLDYRIM